MTKKPDSTIKKKLNVTGLISFLLFFLAFPLLLVPWHRLFVLRSDTISTLVIHVIGLFVLGIIMLTLGLIAVVRTRKQKGTINGNWMGIVGLVFGVLFASFGGFFIVDYLTRGAS